MTTTDSARTYQAKSNIRSIPRGPGLRCDRWRIRSAGSSRFRSFADSEEEAIETCRNLLSRCPAARFRCHAPDGTSFSVTLDPDDETLQIDSVSSAD